MSTYTKAELQAIAYYVAAESQEKEETAGYAGYMHDGGGGALKREAVAFLAGLDGTLPAGWEKYAERAKLESEEDYKIYVRLRAKYEGR